MRRITIRERQDRLASRHRLADPADEAVAAVRSMIVLHASDPAAVFLSAAARLRDAAGAVAAMQRALYEDRSLVKVLAMRRTMFVAPRQDYAMLDAGCTREIAAKERKKLLGWLTGAGVEPDAATWLSALEVAVLDALREPGGATTTQLSAAVEGLRLKIDPTPGKPYSRPTPIASHVLFVLAAAGHVVRGQPQGSWTSSLNQWVSLVEWLGGPLEALDPGAARVALVERYLRVFGPAPRSDIKWWTGLTAGKVDQALAALDTVEVALEPDGASALLLADDAEPASGVEAWAALLPALDPTPMGWQERSWFLGAHGRSLFDRSGNIGPTIWWQGRIVGGWAQRAGGELALRLLEDVGAEGRAAIERATEHMRVAIGETSVTPRFRTPLERELAA